MCKEFVAKLCALSFVTARGLGGRALATGRQVPLPKSRVFRNEEASAAIAQLVARRSHNPKVVSSILTRRIEQEQGEQSQLT